MKKLILLLVFCFTVNLVEAKPSFRKNNRERVRAENQIQWEHCTAAKNDGIRIYRNQDGTRRMPLWYKVKKSLK